MSSASLRFAAPDGKALPMGNDRPEMTKEERLAAKLRENLHRRKAQARQKQGDDAPPLPKTAPKS